MVVTLLVISSFVFKHLMAQFETTNIDCRWHEAALPQAIIPHCAREFIKMCYNMHNGCLLTQCLGLCITPIYLDIVQHHCLQSSKSTQRYFQVKVLSRQLPFAIIAKSTVLTCLLVVNIYFVLATFIAKIVTWSVRNRVCYERGLLWKWRVMKVVCCERVC